jgi:hypothetical protein
MGSRSVLWSMRTFGIALLCFWLAGCSPTLSLSSSGPGAGQPSASTAPATVDASVGPEAEPSVGSAVSTNRFADGLPRSIGGEPVLRGAEVLAKVQAADSDAPFLVGVWLDVYTGPRSCFADRCPSGIAVSDEAGSGTSVLQDGNMAYQFATGLATGPAVLQVHVDDPRVSPCPSATVACDRLIVVDKAIWTGDSFTDPQPLTVAAVVAAIHRLDPAVSLTLIGDGDMRTEPGLTDAQGLAPNSTLPAPDQLAGVYVMPSVAAMRRALPGVVPGSSGTAQPSALRYTTNGEAEGGYKFAVAGRWLVVENVAFSVLTSEAMSSADKAFLDRLVAALEVAP